MKKTFKAVEDLFVAVAFAEAGEYDSLCIAKKLLYYREPVRVHA